MGSAISLLEHRSKKAHLQRNINKTVLNQSDAIFHQFEVGQYIGSCLYTRIHILVKRNTVYYIRIIRIYSCDIIHTLRIFYM